MATSVIWTILLCALGTFLLRLVPMALYGQHALRTGENSFARRFLQAIGPAAIAALLVVSVWPTVQGADTTRIAGTAAGLAAVVAAKRTTGGLARPTLLGAAVYGVWVGLLT